MVLNFPFRALAGRRCLAAVWLLLLSALSSNALAKDNLETAGDILQFAIPAAAYGATWILEDEEGRSEFYRSLVVNLGITHALKYLVDKKRPKGDSTDAFPSGHTSASFQGAAFVHRRYGLKYAIPGYLASAFVGYSRVASDWHDEVDVVAGALIGGLSGYFLTSPNPDFVVTPSVAGDALGLHLAARW